MKPAEACFTSGYILAGGKSTRMGMDKGLMLLNDQPIIQHVIDQLQRVVNTVIIVSNNVEYKKFGCEVVEDVLKDVGPAGGIYSALHHSTDKKNFVVSCDMPFITADAIRFMIDHADTSEITLPLHNENLEPLFGVYSKQCLPKWKLLIEKGIVKLQDLTKHFNLLKITVDGNKIFDEMLFMNLNTQEDFEKAAHLTTQKS